MTQNAARDIVDFAMADKPAEVGRVFSTTMVDRVTDAISGVRTNIARDALGSETTVFDANSGESTDDTETLTIDNEDTSSDEETQSDS